MLTPKELKKFVGVVVATVLLCAYIIASGNACAAPSWAGPEPVPEPEPPVVYHRVFPKPYVLVECVRPKGNLMRNMTEHPSTRRDRKFLYQYGSCFSI